MASDREKQPSNATEGLPSLDPEDEDAADLNRKGAEPQRGPARRGWWRDRRGREVRTVSRPGRPVIKVRAQDHGSGNSPEGTLPVLNSSLLFFPLCPDEKE